ncbi:tape measure protein [Secundilactobacillus kimchicus]|uniref:tape measure protein n=1 Tax=Secundilactobacillus kimchicus TaxID=528209 RepID=UPI0006E213A6|nr:tape measure protein [Secundilactobacillus kimchicus]
MAGTEVSATIKLVDAFSGTLGKLKSGLGGAGAALSQLSGNAGKTGSMFKSVLGGTLVGQGITKGISAIGGGLKSMYGELDESSRAWQTFNGNMGMLGKSDSQIATTRAGLQKFAQQTIYSASDMASTYSQLAAVGTKNTGKLVKGFGGLAAAASNPQQAMKTLSQQATQAAAKPKIQWMDFKLMLEQTPAGMAMVAKTMHKSTGQLVKDVQAGKVKTQDFFNAIAKTGTNANFSKMATQYKTVGQAMDGLRETAANKLQPAFDAVSKVGIKAVSKLTDSLGNINVGSLTKSLVPMAQGVVNGITSVFKLIGQAMSNIGKMDPGVLKALGVAFVALKAGTSGLVLAGAVAGLKALASLSPGTLNAVAIGITAIAAAMVAMKAAKGIAGIFNVFKGLKAPKIPKVQVPDGTAAGKSALAS